MKELRKLGLVGEEEKELLGRIALELCGKFDLVGEEDKELRKLCLVGEEHKELLGVIAGELPRLLVGHDELVVAKESGTDNVILALDFVQLSLTS